jgi:hypothetical protein
MGMVNCINVGQLRTRVQGYSLFLINTQPHHDFLSKPASLSISSSSNFASTTSGECDYYGNDRAHPCYTKNARKGKQNLQ